MSAFITLSAFADEISPDPVEQFDVMVRCKVKHVELRSSWKTNVLDLSDDQVDTIEKLLTERGMGLSAIGSPIGKVKISDPWEPHLQRFHRAITLAKRFSTPNIRVFSYYPADDGRPAGVASRSSVNGVVRKNFASVARSLFQSITADVRSLASSRTAG